MSTSTIFLAYNLCVLLQRKLGQLERWSYATQHPALAIVFTGSGLEPSAGKPTLKLAVRGEENPNWFREILNKLLTFANCNAVDSLQA